MKTRTIASALALLACWAPVALVQPQEVGAPAATRAFENAHAKVLTDLENGLIELDRLREQMASEKIPMSEELSRLEDELNEVRTEFQKTSRKLESRTLDLTNLRTEIESRSDEATYLSSLLADYIRNFESRLHIAELQRYEAELEAAELATEDRGLTPEQVFLAQAGMLDTSLERLEEALGGARFEGTAVDPTGLVKTGMVVIVGPYAVFRSADGATIGTAEQRLGSLEPSVIPFGDPADRSAAQQVVTTGAGVIPLDPTLGNAHKIAATEETFLEHVQKGGTVMYPIFAMAAAALLVALYKWLVLSLQKRPSQKQIDDLLDAVERHDEEAARHKASEMPGPLGRMLTSGVLHIDEPRELIEEVMYETVLKTKLRLQSLLPFIAICAASAPLLGLLGTVTGIIDTFKLITVFGSGDVKMLSGGISEALITTECGLIIAIPSLLLHAFLSRKARSVIGQMETAAVAFLNRLGKAPYEAVVPVAPAAPVTQSEPASSGGSGRADSDAVREQVKEVLSELLSGGTVGKQRRDPAEASSL